MKEQLDKLREEMKKINDTYSSDEGYKKFRSELTRAGLVTGKKTSRKRGKAKPGKEPSPRVLRWKKFVTMLEVAPAYRRDINSNLVKFHLMRMLRYTGFDVVIHELTYRNSLMDVFCLQNRRAVEFEVKLSREDYLTDFSKLYYYGPNAVNKHAIIAAGKSIVSRFYFVVPENMIDIRECPAHAGLIWFTETPAGILFRIVRYAPSLHHEQLSADSLYTIMKRLYLRCENILDRYSTSLFLKTFKNQLSNGSNEQATGAGIPAPADRPGEDTPGPQNDCPIAGHP